MTHVNSVGESRPSAWTMEPHGRRGFTFVELVAVLVLLVLFVACLLPVLNRARALGLLGMCGGNLNSIYKGVMLYQQENNDRYPILPDIDQKQVIDYAAPLRLGSDCTAAELGTGAQQNLCLMVKNGSAGWGLFNCPLIGKGLAVRDRDEYKYGLGKRANGQDHPYCDYAVQIPYVLTPDGVNAAPLVNASPPEPNLDSRVVILADRGPKEHPDTQWSPNHRRVIGENYVLAGGNVEFLSGEDRPADVNAAGYGGNNIYTADRWEMKDGQPSLVSSGTQTRSPTDPNGRFDSVLYHYWGTDEP